jgi:serine/threonine protein kinase
MRKFASNVETVVRDPALTPAATTGASELRAGETLASKYLLLRPLGMGGMGEVWLAKNQATGAEVALKVLLPERMSAHDGLERFRREAHATAQLAHRAIVRAFDLLELDPAKGTLLLVLERLHGHTLAERLEHIGRLGVSETLDVVLPILSGLEHAHRAGVVHRDLKPENIFLAVEPDGQILPKLVDFGISKMRNAAMSITARGALVGTPCYMAPEQARAEEIDPRTDIFAMGVVIHECLAGVPPFGGQQLHEVFRAVLEDAPAPLPDVSPELWAVIARALAKRPEERFASAADLADALAAAVPDHRAALQSIPVPPQGPKSMTSVPPAVSPTKVTLDAPRPKRRAGMVALFAVSVGLALVAVGRGRFAPSRRATAFPHREDHQAKQLVASADVAVPEPAAQPPELPRPLAPLPPPPRPHTVHAPAAPPPAPAPAAPAPSPKSHSGVVKDPGF